MPKFLDLLCLDMKHMKLVGSPIAWEGRKEECWEGKGAGEFTRTRSGSSAGKKFACYWAVHCRHLLAGKQLDGSTGYTLYSMHCLTWTDCLLSGGPWNSVGILCHEDLLEAGWKHTQCRVGCRSKRQQCWVHLYPTPRPQAEASNWGVRPALVFTDGAAASFSPQVKSPIKFITIPWNYLWLHQAYKSLHVN